LPTPTNLRLRRAIRRLDDWIYRWINEQRASHNEGVNFLSALQQARLEPGGSHMTERQLRDEAMNLFLAGRETTALALAWTLYLLAHNPQALPELEAELRNVLGGRAPIVADLAALRYTERVVIESLRLYPPAYALKRQAIDDVEIGGHPVPAGTMVIVAQWVLHRDPRYFDKPNVFDPNRWADGLAQRLPRFAYFPFGGGPRFCIGHSLALMSAVLVLATIAQRFRVAPAPGHVVKLRQGPTLRPWPGIHLVLKARRLES
jgi:cytochrome P450